MNKGEGTDPSQTVNLELPAAFSYCCFPEYTPQASHMDHNNNCLALSLVTKESGIPVRIRWNVVALSRSVPDAEVSMLPGDWQSAFLHLM